jgi:hypothetical protein
VRNSGRRPVTAFVRGSCKTHRNDKFNVGRMVPPIGQVHPTHRNHFRNLLYTRACGPEPPSLRLILQLPLDVFKNPAVTAFTFRKGVLRLLALDAVNKGLAQGPASHLAFDMAGLRPSAHQAPCRFRVPVAGGHDNGDARGQGFQFSSMSGPRLSGRAGSGRTASGRCPWSMAIPSERHGARRNSKPPGFSRLNIS